MAPPTHPRSQTDPEPGEQLVTSMPPATITGDMVSDRILALAGVQIEHLRRMWAVNVEAMEAVAPEERTHKMALDKSGGEHHYVEVKEGGAPDHPVRLRASENLAEWAGLRASRKSQPQVTGGEGGLTADEEAARQALEAAVADGRIGIEELYKGADGIFRAEREAAEKGRPTT